MYKAKHYTIIKVLQDQQAPRPATMLRSID